MTQRQAIRSVLKDTSKFIIGDYNGHKWYCPDAYIATVDDIYSQYKPKKSQDINAFSDISKQPKMASIIDKVNTNDYIQVQHFGDIQDNGIIHLFSGQHDVLVNNRYLEFMQVLYPTATFEIDTAYWYSPVRVVVKDYINGGKKLVALIMPLHK